MSCSVIASFFIAMKKRKSKLSKVSDKFSQMALFLIACSAIIHNNSHHHSILNGHGYAGCHKPASITNRHHDLGSASVVRNILFTNSLFNVVFEELLERVSLIFKRHHVKNCILPRESHRFECCHISQRNLAC